MDNLTVIDERKVLDKDFRMYGTFDEPLFLAKDVAEWIEHQDVTSMLRGVDEDEKVLRLMSGEPGKGGNPNKWFLTEDGLYEVLMQSRKPIAKQFKKKVKEILKEIRKTGSYSVHSTKDMSADELLNYLENQLKLFREQWSRMSLVENKISSLTRSHNGVALRHELTDIKQQEQLDNHEQQISDLNKVVYDHGPADEVKEIIGRAVHLRYYANYDEGYSEFYEVLQNTYHVALAQRLTRLKKRRQVEDGWSLAKVNKLSKLNAITASPDIWPQVRQAINDLSVVLEDGGSE